MTHIIIHKDIAQKMNWSNLVSITICISKYYDIEAGFCYNINNHKAISSLIVGDRNGIDFKFIHTHLRRYPYRYIGDLHTHCVSPTSLLSITDFPVSPQLQEITTINCHSLDVITINKIIFQNKRFRLCWTQYAFRESESELYYKLGQYIKGLAERSKITETDTMYSFLEQDLKDCRTESAPLYDKAAKCLKCMVHKFNLVPFTIDKRILDSDYQRFVQYEKESE